MKYTKQCNGCSKHVDEGFEPYLQLHGSVSQQHKDEWDGNIYYRYLTPEPKSRLVFCTSYCFVYWVGRREEQVPYVQKVIPSRPIY